MHRALARRGFTIVEVVVTIAVIALLMGLLFPVLGAVQRTARNTLCMSNIRNFVAADLAYMTVHQRLPPMSPYVPTSIGVDRIRQIGQYCGQRVPEGDAFTWPRRENQPDWINCPCAVHSGYAEGPTVGGGVYTGYAYYGGLADSQIVSSGLGTVVNPGHASDSRASERGVMWADILAEFPTTEERRFEIFHVRPRTVQYTDFRFYAREVDAIHRGWSDGSVERVKLRLDEASPDQRLQTFLGNYYF